jgi:short-subunit dehydrogenase
MNIIVTGGSNGIGKEVALYLSKDLKNNILITGRDQLSLTRVKDSAEKKNIHILVHDLTKMQFGHDAFRESVNSVFDSIDILINNAGSLHSKSFLDTTPEQAREMMEVNFFAPMQIIRSLYSLMNEGAHIVNISSMGGFQGSAKFRGLSYYSASKAALACISECLAVEFSKDNIHVNCLALGSVRTGMLEKAFPGFKAPVTAEDMGKLIGDFALTGGKFFNGKVIPVALSTP